MTQVLEVTEQERPVLSFMIARMLPLWREGSGEQRDVAARLTYVLTNMDQAPPGPGEVEFSTQDLYELGIHTYEAAVALEENWLDGRRIVRGLEPAQEHDPAEVEAVRKYFSDLERDPLSWSYQAVHPAFIDLGFKLDRLFTADA